MTIVFKKILFLLILLETCCDSEIEENYYKGVIFMGTKGERLWEKVDVLRYQAESFKKFSDFKVVIVVEQKDILESDRSDKVREDIKSLSNYIGILDDDNTTSLTTLSKSIGILVLENDDNDQTVFHLKEKLISLIEEKQIFQNKSFKNEIDLYYFLKKLVDKLVHLEKNLNYYNITNNLSSIYKIKDDLEFYEEKFKNFSTLLVQEVNITMKKLVVYIRDQ
jgi:hypothetical protein